MFIDDYNGTVLGEILSSGKGCVPDSLDGVFGSSGFRKWSSLGGTCYQFKELVGVCSTSEEASQHSFSLHFSIDWGERYAYFGLGLDDGSGWELSCPVFLSKGESWGDAIRRILVANVECRNTSHYVGLAKKFPDEHQRIIDAADKLYVALTAAVSDTLH